MSFFPAFLTLIGTTMGIPPEHPRAVEMAVVNENGVLVATLQANSPVTQAVTYELVMQGESSSRHRGKTTLRANDSAVLSTMRMVAGDNWCVSAKIVEADGQAYEYREGPLC